MLSVIVHYCPVFIIQNNELACYTADMETQFFGNQNSLIVHMDDCETALQIHPNNLVVFSDLHHALQQGYEECGFCFGGYREYERKKLYIFSAKQKIRDKCLICGETRGIQAAHIFPRRLGGTSTMPLCPNHHWNYDHGLLNEDEVRFLKAYFRERFKQTA